MKKFVVATLIVLTIVGNGILALGAPTKGVQAVLLHRWGPTSTSNLVQVLRNTADPEVEVSFAPNVAASAADPYKNMRNIIDGLLGQKRVYAVVYLNFHATGSSVNGLDKFRAFFGAYKDKAQIVVSPSLEDFATVSEINVAARNIALNLGGGSIGKLILRRSPDPTNLDQLRPSRTVSINGSSYSFKSVELEKHGVIGNASGANVYSNDGVFVYDPEMLLFGATRELASMFSSVNTSTKYSLSTFRSRASGIRTSLWRPAYNMYRDCDGRYMARTSRTFSDCNGKAFDVEEAKVLRRFFGLL
ncbi:MAG: hypothetical protein IPJ30_08850 [Acidobacteria bacterium]|nr:hypothetical protein [Acidobacteriota bacterium]